MNNASTPDGRGQDRPNDAELFFPSEGSFNPVVPLSELGYAPPPLPPVEAADVGQPAEAAWARDAHRAGLKEEERTLVPARAGGARQPRVGTAAVIALSVAAGLVSGTYLIWSSQRAPVVAEAPGLPPAPVAERGEATKSVEQVNEPARAAPPGEVAKAVRPGEVAPAPKQEPPVRTSSAPRAARPARAVAEPKVSTPAPKPARTQSDAPARPRLTTAERRPPAPAGRTLPVSSPPPSARSKKVIQWP
jgi:hypothetical protein